MDNIDNVFNKFRKACLNSRSTVYECPTCHKPYNLINDEESYSTCLNCGRSYFQQSFGSEIVEGQGVFLSIKNNSFLFGTIAIDEWNISCKRMIEGTKDVLNAHPNACDYFILHSYKNGIVTNIDFKDML